MNNLKVVSCVEFFVANLFDWNAIESKINWALGKFPDLNRTKALTVVSMAEILGIDLDEAVDAITDNGNDRSADAIFIDERETRKNIHIFQTKCVSAFEKSANNFPGGEVDKVIALLNDILQANEAAFAASPKNLQSKVRDAVELLRQPGARISVHFLGNLGALVEAEEKRLRTTFQKYRAVDFISYDLDGLSDFFLEKKSPNLVRSISVVDTNFFDRVDKNLRGLVCTVAATEIVEIIKSESNPSKIETSIFDQNVRVYLKRGNKINKRIIESALSDDNHMFWYQNNGITITCDKYEQAPTRRSPMVTIHNIQIVNGGQTSNCLFEAAAEDPARIQDVLILVRIIETNSEEVKLAVAESTNSQTPINVRDLRSNDRQQRQYEDAFANLGYYYERKSGQHSDKDQSRCVDALTAGQAYLAYGVGLPEVAKKDRGRVFGDLYDTVFAEDVTAEKLLVSFQLSEIISNYKLKVRRKIKNEEELGDGEISIIDGSFHVLFAIRQLCSNDEQDMWDISSATLYIQRAIEIVAGIYSDQSKNITNFSSNRFFKETSTKDKITKGVR